MSILIVDDCREGNRNLQALLQAHGYPRVQTAETGEEALDILQKGGESSSDFDVVITDVNMPGVTGLELCRRLKEVEQLRDIPVLVVTGEPTEKVLEKAFEVGACDFLAKPINPLELIARVRAALKLKQEMDSCKARQRQLLQVTEQLQQLNAELQRLSILDELTGIANRRFFNLLFEQEWGRATRAVLPLSLILIDIDFFKNYNDHYGHPTGDKCLQQVASTMHSLIRRPGDVVARYGGEEFVVLLSHTGLQGAVVVAEALRRGVEELHVEHACSAASKHVTISLGVATTIPSRGHSAESLFSAADQAVYEAKRAGRNRVKAFPGFPEEAYPLARKGQQFRSSMLT